ncbi:MAG: hypothetical protein M1508_06070 [Nitrospirae bacterium]|nr:hypothetical protein [Nitrospirota bacterium]MCL5420927.1 hypothetical protein [Nitrospirota bacterium]
MKKRQLLLVTYHDEQFDEGLSYAVDLARMMNDSIAVLVIYKRKVMERFEDIMTVVTFAEANEHKTARELIREDCEKKNENYDEKIALLIGRCRKSGVVVDVSTAAMDVVSAIKNFLRQNASIDMVLLSPNITTNGNVSARELNKLVRTASRPVVTMARNTRVA